MEHLQDQHLNEPQDTWTPWQADEEMLYGIMTGLLIPPVMEAPEAEQANFPRAA
jgi:hypothetical protein